MGLFRKKQKEKPETAAEKLTRIERNIWELENKQIMFLEKMKAVVLEQAKYKEEGLKSTDKNMQRYYAAQYIECERKKEQYASSINEVSSEIITNGRMAQLVDTEVLNVTLGSLETLSLTEINDMSDSIREGRERRDEVNRLKNEAIDRAFKGADKKPDSDVDRVLSLWEEEKSLSDLLLVPEKPAQAEAEAETDGTHMSFERDRLEAED